MLEQAKEDPLMFLKSIGMPSIIDEVQYLPEIFRSIKFQVDKENIKGMYYLTGSQSLNLLSKTSESLAGRVGIIKLLGVSLREKNNAPFNEEFLPTDEYLNNRKKNIVKNSYMDIWSFIQQGSMPEVVFGDMDSNSFYETYVTTYIERDVRNLSQVGDVLLFSKFMVSLASRIGQLLNLNEISKEIGISNTQAQKWLSILVESNIIYLLEPYYNNILKRSIKTPKIYFLDTGMAAFLTKWSNSDVLESGNMSGSFFENFVIVEILKSYYNKGILHPSLYFYRDKVKNEIDLIIEKDGKLYPIEIKKSSKPSKDMISTFKVLDNIQDKEKARGTVICMYDDIFNINENNIAIPIDYI